MLSSPRSPDSTMRIFSSAVNCRRVTRRISFTTCSAGFLTGPDFCPIFAPSMATMGQKSSLLQLSQSVSWALMPDNRMRFLWPDEIDADKAHYERWLAKWGSDEAIDDMEHAFGSLFWQMPERVPCVALDAQTGQAARKQAAALWQRHPRL